MLKETLQQPLEKLNLCYRFIFQHDNDPKNELQKAEVNVTDWAWQSLG